MAIPVLIDTDMGIDDAVAIALALAAVELDVVGLVSVGGNVALEQATRNIGRLLSGLGLTKWPAVGRGLDQDGQLSDAAHVFNADGLGGVDLVEPADFAPEDYRTVYERAIRTHGEALCIVAIGPLTNLAAVMREMPEVLARVGRIIVMGGRRMVPGEHDAMGGVQLLSRPRGGGRDARIRSADHGCSAGRHAAGGDR